MSRSNNTEIQNPAKRFLVWNGAKGGFKFFDKSQANEDEDKKGENVDVPLPFTFVVLDILSSIRGFSDEHKSGFWSNEVSNLGGDILVVRHRKGIAAKGLYDNIIDTKELRGAKYCQSLYIATKGPDGKLQIDNIQVVGAAVSAWIDFRKKNKVYECAVTVKEFTTKTKGVTTYQEPIFKAVKLDPKTDQEAKALDMELQKYLKAYFAIRSQEAAEAVPTKIEHAGEEIQNEPTPVHEPDVPQPTSDDDLPF